MRKGRNVQTQHSRHGIRRFLSPVVLFVCAFLFASSGAAFAYFSVSGSGGASAKATTLAAPGTGGTGTATAITLPVSWLASSNLPASGGPPRGYAVLRSTTSGTETQVSSGGCAFSSTSVSTATSCTDSGLTPNTTYFYKVETVYDNWVSSTNTEFSATTTKQATTTSLSNLTLSGAASSAFIAKATVTGNSGFGTPAGTVTFGLFTGSTCSGSAAYSSAADTLSSGSVTGTVTPTVGGTYFWGATYTPTDTFNLTSSACSATPVTVYAVNGSGTMTVSPTAVLQSSTGNALTFTYTAAAGGTNAGEVDVAVPSGWTTPQITNSSAAGYVTTTCAGATLATLSATIKVTALTLAGGANCTIVYGSGSAGVPAPATTGPYTFTSSENSTGGTVVALASSPIVTVGQALGTLSTAGTNYEYVPANHAVTVNHLCGGAGGGGASSGGTGGGAGCVSGTIPAQTSPYALIVTIASGGTQAGVGGSGFNAGGAGNTASGSTLAGGGGGSSAIQVSPTSTTVSSTTLIIGAGGGGGSGANNSKGVSNGGSGGTTSPGTGGSDSSGGGHGGTGNGIAGAGGTGGGGNQVNSGGGGAGANPGLGGALVNGNAKADGGGAGGDSVTTAAGGLNPTGITYSAGTTTNANTTGASGSVTLS
jgi:hypothetical protein